LKKIQKLNKMNAELQEENEKLLKKIEDIENDYKTTQSYSYHEHFKKMFVRFIEQMGHKYFFYK